MESSRLGFEIEKAKRAGLLHIFGIVFPDEVGIATHCG